MIDSILPFAVAHLFLGYGLLYTSPISPQRPFLLAPIIICCLISVRSTISNKVPGQIGNDYVIGFILHASNFLCLARLSPPPHSKPSARRSWALNQIFNGRWGTLNTPSFSYKLRTYVPTRLELFLHRLWAFTWTAGLIYFLQTYRLYVDFEDFLTVPNGFLHRISYVTLREAIVRFYMLVLGTTIPYCTLCAAHSILSCLAIACRDTPSRWPPLFGSFADAYTVRRWYSVWWHHLMRKAFTSHAIVFVSRILRLPPKGPFTRYVIIITTFMLSALLHILADPGVERCTAYPQVRFYLSIIGAIVLEDFSIWTYRSVMRPARTNAPGVSKTGGTVSKPQESHVAADDKKKVFYAKNSNAVTQDQEAPHFLWKLVGFVWVLLFETWAVSKLMYATYSC
ncbi:hypothetical protein MMC13_004653 [Lambiella insularis]|nr:hypothetical protein [Lambiella insularis]